MLGGIHVFANKLIDSYYQREHSKIPEVIRCKLGEIIEVNHNKKKYKMKYITVTGTGFSALPELLPITGPSSSGVASFGQFRLGNCQFQLQ